MSNKIYRFLISEAKQRLLLRRRAGLRCDTEDAVRGVRSGLEELTDEERRRVAERRGFLGNEPYWTAWRVFKTYCGFDERFVADDDYVLQILRVLNHKPYCNAYDYKGMFGVLFSGMRQPEVLLNSVNGVWYSGGGKVVEKNEGAISRIFGEAGVSEFIIKPTIGSSGGRGVRKVSVGDGAALLAVLEGYGANFVCQRVVRQSAQTARFNEDSLNTIRVCTLNLNGRCTVTNVLFRHGNAGCCFDNGGGGGNMVGVNMDGSLKPEAWNKRLERAAASASGVVYGEARIEGLERILALAVESHARYLPNMGFAGWDFALDENEDIVLIEVNLTYPGILFEQICGGAPIFAGRSEEVFDYVREHLYAVSPLQDWLCPIYESDRLAKRR